MIPISKDGAETSDSELPFSATDTGCLCRKYVMNVDETFRLGKSGFPAIRPRDRFRMPRSASSSALYGP